MGTVTAGSGCDAWSSFFSISRILSAAAFAWASTGSELTSAVMEPNMKRTEVAVLTTVPANALEKIGTTKTMVPISM